MTANYEGLLRLCGMEADEIERQAPRIEKVFNRIGIGSEDIENAEKRVREQHDVELLGVRKLLRAWMLELFDLVLAKDEGKKIFYYAYPCIQGPGMAIRAAAPDELWVGCPDVVICHTVGQLFNKLDPILEAGESRGLPPGHAMCSLQQIRNGGIDLGIIPIPDLTSGSSYYCEIASKTDELLHEIYGYPVVFVDGSMDSRWGEFPDYDPERVKFLGSQLDKLFSTVKETMGVEVTRETWGKALLATRQIFSAIGELTQLMMADPIPLSSVETGLAINLAAACTGISMSEGPDAVRSLCEDVRERVERGEGIMEKGAPRVMNFVQPFSDASITHMIEDAGLALGASITTVRPAKGDPPVPPETLGEELAVKAMRGGAYHSNYGFVTRFEESIKTLNIDGLIYGYQYSCRPLAQCSHLFKQYIEENAGVPVLPLEMDYYESRSYGPEALRTKVETFAEMLKARKANAASGQA
ncbi:2-hydroxyacyl-CoA dehydratase [Thermodesulfobacteriota bacterium]